MLLTVYETKRLGRDAAELTALADHLTARPVSSGSRITARIHHAIDHLQHYHPDLAAHLRAAIRTGTACTYQPA